MAEPDFEKMAQISERARQASMQPGYGREQYDALVAEAEKAVGDAKYLMEFMVKYRPTGSPSRP